MRDLTTARLLLRPIGPDDASALHVLWTNKEVRRYLWDNRILPLDAGQGSIAVIGASGTSISVSCRGALGRLIAAIVATQASDQPSMPVLRFVPGGG